MTKLNKQLAMVLAGLILVYVLSISLHLAGRESNTRAVTFHTDTTGTTEIDLYPYHAGRQEIKLVRTPAGWQLRTGSQAVSPVRGSAEALLSALVTVPTQRLVSRNKDRWDNYKVGDTTGTRVVVYKGKAPIADYFIGGGSSSEGGGSSLNGGGPSAGAGGASTAYIRANGHSEVYAADSYLESMVDKPFAGWRDKSVLRLSTTNITGISFQGTPGYVLSKKDSTWWLAGGRVSTDSINRYLNSLQYYDLSRFADDFTASASPDRSILFSGAKSPLATLQAWRRPDGSWVVNSSQNPAAYFAISDSALTHDLWRNPSAWVK
ncbi:MAG TPA: DUF4340 domain-containing protein [Puia sp.]|nr:DUF4340 domain-containing protein [Puia sp.]